MTDKKTVLIQKLRAISHNINVFVICAKKMTDKQHRCNAILMSWELALLSCDYLFQMTLMNT